MQATEFEQTFMAYKTMVEMMQDRGYFVQQNQLNMTEESFKEKFNVFSQESGMLEIFEHVKEERKILVYFVKILSQISTQDITQFNKVIRDKEVYNGIIIANKPLSSAAEKLVNDINIDDKYHLEFF